MRNDGDCGRRRGSAMDGSRGPGLPVQRRSLALCGLALLCCLTAACSGGGESQHGTGEASLGSCPNDLPDACANAPSYTNDVAPVVAAHCASCHSPGGVEGNHDFTTYQGIYQERSRVLPQVFGCRMPPGSAAPLSQSDRAVLLSWLVCGAPP